MHTPCLKICAIAAAVVGLSTAAHAAGDTDQRGWNISIVGGASGGLSGSLLPASENSILNLSGLDPTLSGAGSVAIDRLRYNDVFRSNYNAGIEAGYGLTNHVSIATRLTVARFLGRGLELGVVSGNEPGAPQTLAARFQDTEDLTWQVGSRYLWIVGQRWRPFIGGGLGITRPDKVRANVTSTDPTFAARMVDFTDNRHVLSASLIGGADLSLAKTFGLRFSVGADYAGAPRGASDPMLGTLGVNVDREAGARVDYPLEIDAVFKLR